MSKRELAEFESNTWNGTLTKRRGETWFWSHHWSQWCQNGSWQSLRATPEMEHWLKGEERRGSDPITGVNDVKTGAGRVREQHLETENERRDTEKRGPAFDNQCHWSQRWKKDSGQSAEVITPENGKGGNTRNRRITWDFPPQQLTHVTLDELIIISLLQAKQKSIESYVVNKNTSQDHESKNTEKPHGHSHSRDYCWKQRVSFNKNNGRTRWFMKEKAMSTKIISS